MYGYHVGIVSAAFIAIPYPGRLVVHGPIILTSGTLAVGRDFHRFKEETGLMADGRVTESVSASPFDYKANCLLYLPLHPPEQADSGYVDELAAEIAALLDACWGPAWAFNAASSWGGRGLPRSRALRRIPRQAFRLK